MLLRRPTLSRIINTVDKAKPSYFFYSQKMGQLIFCESRLEYCGNIIMEMDETISQFATQPISFKYEFKGRKQRYTPDFYAKTTNNFHILGEYKPKSKLKAHVNKQGIAVDPTIKFETIKRYVENSGFQKFLLLTEDDVFQEPRLFNVECLHHHAKGQPPDEYSVDVIRRLLTDGPMTVEAIVERLNEAGIDQRALWNLVGNHRISIDITLPIDIDTLVTWRRDNDF